MDRFVRTGVLLVDDHRALCEGMALLLRDAGLRVVGATGDPARAVEIAAARRPAVIVLDLDLGGVDGLPWVPALRQASPESRVLIYTGTAAPGAVSGALGADVDGLALKSGGGGDLVAAVRAVMAGRDHVDPRLRSILADTLGEDLSPREREILGLLAAGLTGEQIAADLVVSPETVRTHVRNAMRKLGAPTRARAIVLALRTGRIREATPGQHPRVAPSSAATVVPGSPPATGSPSATPTPRSR